MEAIESDGVLREFVIISGAIAYVAPHQEGTPRYPDLGHPVNDTHVI
jgi:hypothetical protein